MMDGDMIENWVVVRMAGPRTLAVVASLQAAGISAWTPMLTATRRRPRSNEKRQVVVPLAATFAFAPAEALDRLLAIGRADVRDHPPFSLLRHDGRVVRLRDAQLTGLRNAEERARPRAGTARKGRPDALAVGASVRLGDGPFAGMTGIVSSSDGRRTYLDFGGLLGRVEIETSHVASDALRPVS